MINSSSSAIRQIVSGMPLLFLSHGGGPCFFMDARGSSFAEADKNSPAAAFYRSLREKFATCPSAILVISAHWEEDEFTVGYQTGTTSLIYDYYGFPRETYAPHLTYPCATDLNLANQVCSLLQSAGIECKKSNRGFDHGVFIPMKLAFPDGSIPIVQLSLKKGLNPMEHIQMGEALAPLRQQGVLIIGSGQATHNLSEMHSPGSKTADWAAQFTEWLRRTLEGTTQETQSQSRVSLANIAREAPNFNRCHPREEHLIPLHVVFGAAFPRGSSLEPVSGCKRIYTQTMLGTLSLDSYMFQ